ncbi:MAG: phosphate ABC transporter substrate-binding protein PstS [Lentisphaerota bacterium]
MNSLSIFKRAIVPVLAFFFLSIQAFPVAITGAGSSFIYPIMTAVAKMYYDKTGKEINYQAVGSSTGIAMMNQGTVDFCATEILEKLNAADEGEYLAVPIGASGIVPVVHIEGVKDNQLVLNGNIIVSIYLGTITYWDDPAIKRLNPDLELPHNRIVLITRIGMSGTTYIFSKYLSMISLEWNHKVGAASILNWPQSSIGGLDNAGVANYIKLIKNSIGYIEYKYFVANSLPAKVRMLNNENKIITASYDSFYSAINNYDWSSRSLLINEPGGNSWPIIGLTYFVTKKDKMNEELKHFIEFMIKDPAARDKAKEMGYVLPDNVLYFEVKK